MHPVKTLSWQLVSRIVRHNVSAHPVKYGYGVFIVRGVSLTMSEAGDHAARQPVVHTDEEREQIERFVKALNQAMVSNGVSQRGLCERLGIRIGTMTKYLKGEIAPLKVATYIQEALATALGVSLDALLAYYRDGEYLVGVSLRDVETWLRSDAGQEDLPAIMASLQAAGQRWVGTPVTEEPTEEPLQPWSWPIQELDDAEVSERFRERLGLTEERLEALVERGEYDEDLIEAFSLACNYELDAVREAFQKRQPIT